MHIPSVEDTSEAADLFSTQVMGRLNSADYTLPQLIKAIPPFICDSVGSTDFNGGWKGSIIEILRSRPHIGDT